MKASNVVEFKEPTAMLERTEKVLLSQSQRSVVMLFAILA